jgi:hypothetical protein
MAPTLAALATLLAGANVVILAVLGGIWIQNYRTFRTGLTLGLVLFAAVMLVENVAAIYSFFEWGALYADSQFAKQYITGLRGLQIVALSSIAYVTWQ